MAALHLASFVNGAAIAVDGAISPPETAASSPRTEPALALRSPYVQALPNRTINEPSKPLLSRHDVWTGLEMKANNALPYVPIMQKCEVIEHGDRWLMRNIVVNNVPLQERVTFEPEQRVIFERVAGSEPGRIENIIGEDPQAI